MSQSITVIIPFYQRERGILSKAVQSVLLQQGVGDIEVLIIDDASPVSARDELAELMSTHPGAVRIIEQSNGGPAAARNAGLAQVRADCEFVAFLDSDDEWIPSHLANALIALGDARDFYFADHFQLHQTVSAFKRAGRIDPNMHKAIDGSGYLYAFEGDMFNQVLTGNVIGTSTVVYRYRRFPALRFREAFVYAGEDYLFWLELAKLTENKICFSTLCETTYGEGVNIFAGSGWGTEHAMIRVHYEIKYKKALGRLFDLSPAQARIIGANIRELRRAFVADLLHRISHRKQLKRDVLARHWRTDPQSFLLALPIAAAILLKR